jgi:hypothetical protein
MPAARPTRVPVSRQRPLARPRYGAAADQPHSRQDLMQSATRPGRHEAHAAARAPHDAVGHHHRINRGGVPSHWPPRTRPLKHRPPAADSSRRQMATLHGLGVCSHGRGVEGVERGAMAERLICHVCHQSIDLCRDNYVLTRQRDAPYARDELAVHLRCDEAQAPEPPNKGTPQPTGEITPSGPGNDPSQTRRQADD